MAVTFTNNFKNILDKLQNILRTEFKGAVPVYIGNESVQAGTQFIRLEPQGSELVEFKANSETREFTINIYYYFLDKNIKKTSLDHVLRYVSRIEALIHDNLIMTLADSTKALNTRIDSTTLDTLEDENEYVVEMIWRGQHTGNMS
tara:strand:+ start:630 stop:1067 length:438 start_codon:yes stop_codon:yes gene_type:complete